jgi:sulfur-oxidizing protein SoxY
MIISRRAFIHNAVALGVSASILPLIAQAERNASAFGATKFDDVLKGMFGDAKAEDSDKVKVSGPEIAENGKVVPIEINADLDKIESISIIAEKNPMPLLVNFKCSDKVGKKFKTRIKMAKTGKVIAIVKADGKLYQNHTIVKVTIGGCGG